MGGVLALQSVQTVADNLTVRPIKASTWRFFSRVSVFVVAGLALILEALRVQTYVWVVAVHIVQPDGMVYDQAWLLATLLTYPTIQGQPCIYVRLPGPSPGHALVELFLGHADHSNEKRTDLSGQSSDTIIL